VAWPEEVIEERAGDIAEVADVLLRYQGAWRHRRVETVTVLSHEQMRRHVSIDFTVPEAQREGLRISPEEFVVPLALLDKRPLVHFDLRNEEQHAIALLTADQHRTLARELLYRLLDGELPDEGFEAAGELIEDVLADEPQDVEDRIAAFETVHGVELPDFRATASVLAGRFILWAIVRGLDRRRVFKFAYDEPLGRGPGSVFGFGARGCTEALSYHLEVAVPDDLKARSTRLVDTATRRRLAAGEPDTDRPALFFRAEAPVPEAPWVLVDFAVERWRFLAPAALVATIIALLVAPTFLFADLRALPDTAGAAVLVLSTSAVFSLIVLRAYEHPLLRLMLTRARMLLAASTVAAVFAAASIGFDTAGWVIDGTWALAALVSVLTAGILILETLRAPS
jgi:hypothetical protein